MELVAIFLATFAAAPTLAEFSAETERQYSRLSEPERRYVDAIREQKTFSDARMMPLGWYPGDLELPRRLVSDPPLDSEVSVIQVIDDRNMLIRLFGDRPAWVSGVVTSGYVDDSRYTLKRPPIVAQCGTTMYGTATGGSRTVAKLCMANTKAAADIVSAHDRLTRSRHFTGIGDATFVEITGGMAHFMLFDDSVKSVKPSSLPLEEQEWMRKVIAADKKAKR